MLSSCYSIWIPGQHHHQHWKPKPDTDGHPSHKNEIIIGGQLYVDDIIR